jgi:hypothetical protein
VISPPPPIATARGIVFADLHGEDQAKQETMARKKDTSDMPSTIERSDTHAQKIWQETHDSAVET